MKLRMCFVAAALALAAGEPANAATYSAMYVFGDSLSDRGNLAEAFGNPFPNPPSFHYSFTNGPVAVSLVAQSLGLSADPSLWLTGFQDANGLFPAGYVPGTSYAVGDATAQLQALNALSGINLPDQIDAFVTHMGNTADPDALYTVFIGGNDVKDATLSGGGGVLAIGDGVDAEIAAITALKAAGARNFLVVNVPDVGGIPRFAQEAPAYAAAATANSLLYNSLLATGLDTLTGIQLTRFDLYDYEKAILANAAKFGITNIADPCYTAAPLSTTTSAACGPNAENIGQFAYWNDVHPTAQVHALIASGIEKALAGDPSPSPVPEPAIWLLLIGGFGMIGVALRQQSGAARSVA